LILFFRQHNFNSVVFLCFFFILGFSRFLIEAPQRNPLHISHIINNKTTYIKGTIYSEPEVKKDKTVFNIATDHIQLSNKWIPCQGLIKIYCKPNVQLKLGNRIII